MDPSDNKHSRTYQACIPCRRRKVRCDLGPVDNPHEPPCVRCRREAKECFFSATRRKKRAADAGDEDELDAADYEIRGGRKRLKDGVVESVDSDTRSVNSPGYISHPLTPGGSLGRLQPLRRPNSTTETPTRDEETDEHVNSHTAALLQTAELHNGHDALNVLIEAATHHRTGSASETQRYASSLPSPAHVDGKPSAAPLRQAVPDASIDPAIMQQQQATASASSADQASAHAAWSRFRFVRNGWFTVKEGMAYIEYFYTYMSPLTPIALPDYRGPDKHAALLENEPMLAVTMLMIASRYMTLSGPGAQGRSHAIHARLWPFTQRMIDRIVWGRDLSGTTLSPDETQPGCDVNPMIRKGLLTLGTVESLLLLTEWHPRMMHFPADEDDTQLMAPKNEDILSNEAGSTDDKGNGHALTSWLEPCFRSDRMCWILLNLAMTVASQIGIFDPDCSRHLQGVPADQQDVYQRRRLHIKSLILAYITQTSGRMGVTAMLPQGYAQPTLSELYNPKRSTFRDSKDVVIHFWLRLATLVKINNEELYANRQQTRDIIKTGKYRELLQRIKPSLVQWRREFETYRNIPILLRHVLIIEYEHTRVILHQLALQAVVERCANNNSPGDTRKVIPPNVLDQWFGGDRQHVDEVMQACRNVLRVVVDGLAPGGYLKHAPVRTFFRIVSVTLVLVKTFAFGAFENEMALSLSLMDRTVETMRAHVVDDVHLSTRFSTFLEVITNRLRPMIVRMSRTHGATSGPINTRVPSRGVSNSPAPQQSRNPDHPNMRADGNGYSYNVPHHNDNFHANGRDSPSHNALYGISTQAYDIGDSGNAFSVMPPPTNPVSPTIPHTILPNHDEYGNPYSGFAGQDFGSDEHVGAYDWLALPLDPILQSSGQDVTGTCFGPGIGDYDMLEVLLGGNSHPPSHMHGGA